MCTTVVKQLFAFPYPPVAKLLEWGSLVLSLKTELLSCVFLCSPEYFTVFVVSAGFFKVKNNGYIDPGLECGAQSYP